MTKRFVRLVPNFLKPTLRKFCYLIYDVIGRLGLKDNMIPSKLKIFGVGEGDFEKTGLEFRDYFIKLANLEPSDRVLDVGCGVGRMALPLTYYLSKEGEYWGFDIVKEGIKWCQSRISPKFSNFHFLHSDVYNKHYNPKGKEQAQNFRFPFDEEFFDFVFLTSVFTHMLPSDLENYLSEISRVLKTGGRCLITFFILNEESESLIHLGRSTLDFRYKINGCSVINKKDPEAAIAYDEQSVKEFFERYGLKIIQPIHYGSWCKRDKFLSYQDIVVASKKGSN